MVVIATDMNLRSQMSICDCSGACTPNFEEHKCPAMAQTQMNFRHK
jgi:hypothetical protein